MFIPIIKKYDINMTQDNNKKLWCHFPQNNY